MQFDIRDDVIALSIPGHQPSFPVAHNYEPIRKIRVHSGTVRNRRWSVQLSYLTHIVFDIFQVPEANRAIPASREQNFAVGFEIEITNASVVRSKRGGDLEGVKANDTDQAFLIAQREQLSVG